MGFDTGPGNTLLDNWTKRHLNRPYDENGQWASSGEVVPELLQRMLEDPYFRRGPPKSTGPEYFNLAWLEGYLVKSPHPPEDIQATLTRLTTRSISSAIQDTFPQCRRIILCGGGVHNRELVAQLARELQTVELENSSEFGIDPDQVEAIAFAWLARQTMSGLSGNLPAVTGARHEVILGGIFPASLK